MAKSKLPLWTSGLGINLISNLIGFIVGGVVTYFSHAGSGWIKPLLCGGAAWLMTFGSILGWRVMKSLPPKVEPVTSENVGQKIRDWLDRFSLTVKSIHEPDSEFFYIVTTDGNKRVSISRSSKSPYDDYLLVKALWAAEGDDKKQIEELSEDELAGMRLAVYLELSRAVVGYKMDGMESLTIFKRVPVSSTLTEADILNAIWEIEATLSSIFNVGAMILLRHRINKQKAQE
jgi:hypothetical protein